MIKEELQKEIEAYCKANKIENLEALVNAMLQRGFTIEKFGEHPAGPTKEVEVKEVEVIKEVVKEVIKEVPVEKIVKVSDDEKTDELLKQVDELNEVIKRHTQTIMRLNKEKDEMNEEFDAKLEEINKMLSGPDTSDLYGEKRGQWGSNLLDLFKRKKD